MSKKFNAGDKSGRHIKVGDLIIYGHALGRCAGLRYGKVMAIKWHDDSIYDYEVGVHVDGQVPHFTVQGVEDDWYPEKPKLSARRGTLQFGDRILVIERDQVPKAVLKLLDAVESP